MLQLTPLGRRQLDAWLQMPVAHMRDVRSELLLKLALLARLHRSAQPLVSAQADAFEPVVAGLEQLASAAGPAEFEATLVGWRLESARGVMRFLKGLAEPTL
jgi:PadR family transcriptional regulator AphA